MRIAHVASEIYPFLKTGGLADAVSALGRNLVRLGHEVAFFMPAYRVTQDRIEFERSELLHTLQIDMDGRVYSGAVYRAKLAPGLSIFFIRRDEFFDRRHAYGSGDVDYDDNDARYIFFCKAVVQTLRLTNWKADVVHCHEWHTGLVPILLRQEEERTGATLAIRTVFTLHNVSFQGLFPRRTFGLTGLPDEFWSKDGVEFYEQISLLKAGIVFADAITTVSPTYAQEIQTPEHGAGMDGVIRSRADSLHGILNGVDEDVWNPETDPLLPKRYSVLDLSGKAACRAELLRRSRLSPDFNGPIFGVASRLTQQKGTHLLLANLSFFAEQDVRLVVMGRGSEVFRQKLAAASLSFPGKIFCDFHVDEDVSHLLHAGADFFLMPSTIEPCGLGQMYSQKYGTVPLVSRVGGLVDTVYDIDEKPDKGTGILFEPTAAAVRGAFDRALQLYADKSQYQKVQKRGMAQDFSWRNAARHYERLYVDSV
jgi:starch synthase